MQKWVASAQGVNFDGTAGNGLFTFDETPVGWQPHLDIISFSMLDGANALDLRVELLNPNAIPVPGTGAGRAMDIMELHDDAGSALTTNLVITNAGQGIRLPRIQGAAQYYQLAFTTASMNAADAAFAQVTYYWEPIIDPLLVDRR